MFPASLPLRPHHPTTFLERGVCVPFTSPMLAGARARPASLRGVELILPNPSGGRGVYILPWESVREYCRPTVHDLRLQETVTALRAVTPAQIRSAAQDVAAEGLAGRAAAAAAVSARQAENQAGLITNFRLLLGLVKQEEPPRLHATPPERAPPAEFERRAKAVIATVAAAFGSPSDAVADALEELSRLYLVLGIDMQMREAWVVRVMLRLEAMHQDIARYAASVAEQSEAEAAPVELVAITAEHTLRCARQTIADAQAALGSLRVLLAAWLRDGPGTAQRLARTEWLLDGWEQICLIWEDACETGRRREAAAELALIVPVIPREAADWLSTPFDMEVQRRLSRSVALNVDWRTGCMTALIARNERLKAHAA